MNAKQNTTSNKADKHNETLGLLEGEVKQKDLDLIALTILRNKQLSWLIVRAWLELYGYEITPKGWVSKKFTEFYNQLNVKNKQAGSL